MRMPLLRRLRPVWIPAPHEFLDGADVDDAIVQVAFQRIVGDQCRNFQDRILFRIEAGHLQIHPNQMSAILLAHDWKRPYRLSRIAYRRDAQDPDMPMTRDMR